MDQTLKQRWLFFSSLVSVIGVLHACGQGPSLEALNAQLVEGSPTVMKKIQKVVIVVLENTDYDATVQQPIFQGLMQQGALLGKYSAITHPSQPNYIAMVAGDLLGVNHNSNVDLDAKHVGDLLESAGKTWKGYGEGFPGNCSKEAVVGAYYRKHFPFISFKNIQSNPVRCANLVDGAAFERDLKAHTLPNFSLYTPDINNDGHDTGIVFALQWLDGFFKRVARYDPQSLSVSGDTLYVVTFDEGSGGGDNRIATLFMGAGVKKSFISTRMYDHYSLLKTIETIFNLQSLGTNDFKAVAIDDIWAGI